MSRLQALAAYALPAHKIWSGRRGHIAALLAGASVTLAFAPFHVVPLAFLAPLALWLAAGHTAPKTAAWRGWLFGVGLFGSGTSWIYVSIHDFGYTDVWLAVVLTALFAAGLALFPASLGWGLAKAMHKLKPESRPASVWWMLPAMWVLWEWFRGWVLTGFPWLSLGYSQQHTALAGWAPILGVYGVSLSVVLTGAALHTLLTHTARRARTLAAAVLAALWGLGGISLWLPWTAEQGRPIQVSLLQGNVSQHVKWSPQFLSQTLDLYGRMTLSHLDSDLIVWPETALPLFYHEAGDYLAQLTEATAAKGSAVLIGLPVQHQETGEYFNSVISLRPRQTFYFKRHLVPFGDYLPMNGWLRGVINFFNLPMSNFSRGDERLPPVLEAAGLRAGISICYEDVFGEEVVRATPEAAYLVNVSNDAWWGHSVGPHQHLQIAAMRALESGRYLVRATNTGITAVVDPRGNIVARIPQFVTEVLTASIQPRRGATPYASVGNGLTIGICGILVGIGVFRSRHGSRGTGKM